MSKQRPILFSTPMVQAILDGRKTQTRRLVKPRSYTTDVVDVVPYEMTDDDSQPIKCPYGKPGDVMWVRETFFDSEPYKNAPLFFNNERYYYKADETFIGDHKWKPSIHMPKEAARIWLKITKVRVEMLQDISRGDAMQEGCPFPNLNGKAVGWVNPVHWFRHIWHSINGEQSWNSNPWVWVVEFERIDKPETTYTNV